MCDLLLQGVEDEAGVPAGEHQFPGAPRGETMSCLKEKYLGKKINNFIIFHHGYINLLKHIYFSNRLLKSTNVKIHKQIQNRFQNACN